MIFTSGSTGLPKGAMITHRGMVNHLQVKIADLALGAGDTVAQTASQCFDISVWQLVAPLISGAAVRIYPDEVAHDPARLLTAAARDGITVLETVPSLMRQMLAAESWTAGPRPGLPDLRWMIPTGEALPADLCGAWAAAYPRVPLLNAYGPTECSDDVTHHVLPAGRGVDDPLVPIGRPVANLRVHVLDPAFRPTPFGAAGELWVGGEGVGRGYLGDPRRTAEVFLPDPFAGAPGRRMYRTGDLGRFRNDGRLEFLGRVDFQVKIRGFRIELGEIEAVLLCSPGVAEAVVLALGSGAETRLAACLVAAGAADPDGLGAFLKRRLPPYMLPTDLVWLERMPLTRNGKIDRAALAERAGAAAAAPREIVAPRDEVEAALAEIFAAVLGVERVSVLTGFYELGGHSLLAARLVARVRESFGVDLSLRAFFEAPTVAELATKVQDLILLQLEQLSDDEAASLIEGREPAGELK